MFALPKRLETRQQPIQQPSTQMGLYRFEQLTLRLARQVVRPAEVQVVWLVKVQVVWPTRCKQCAGLGVQLGPVGS